MFWVLVYIVWFCFLIIFAQYNGIFISFNANNLKFEKKQSYFSIGLFKKKWENKNGKTKYLKSDKIRMIGRVNTLCKTRLYLFTYSIGYIYILWKSTEHIQFHKKYKRFCTFSLPFKPRFTHSQFTLTIKCIRFDLINNKIEMKNKYANIKLENSN